MVEFSSEKSEKPGDSQQDGLLRPRKKLTIRDLLQTLRNESLPKGALERLFAKIDSLENQTKNSPNETSTDGMS